MSLPKDDTLWSALRDVDGVLYDPRPALGRLAEGSASAWDELCLALHRQGRVGDAAYAALPWIVRALEVRGAPDSNLYFMAVMIEDARRNDGNPPIPGWLLQDYERAWRKLEFLALGAFSAVQGEEMVQALIAALAMAKGHVTLARIATFAEEELEALLVEAGVE